jgi:hypothetical protein
MWALGYEQLFVAAKDKSSLHRLGDVEVLFSGTKGEAVKVTKPKHFERFDEEWVNQASLNIREEVWVSPEFPYHRSYWEKATGIVPAEKQHVDHIYGKARASQQGYGFVRLALLPDKMNWSWAEWEKTRLKWETRSQAGRALPDLRPLDDLDALKLRAELKWKELKESLAIES